MNLENTLWMGGLLPGTTESQILDSFKYFNIFPVNIKLIRDKIKNKNKSYCFITFKSFEEAKNVLDFLDGKQIPNSDLIFRLNWSDYQGANKTVYVGGLSPNITKEDLFLFFKQKYKSVHNARIILDEKEISKGYGFVNFKSDREYYLCLKEMNGVNFCGNIIKVKEQIKKDEDYYNGNNKKKKGNINNNNSFNEKNIYNTIFIKNNLININSFTNNNDINLQNNINKYNNNRNNFMIKGNNPNLNNNFIGNVNNNCDKMQNSYVNRNNINNVFNSEINNIPNLNSNQLNECLINKKNVSSFFMKNNKNHENLKMANSESNLLINPKSNQNEPKKQSIPEKSVIDKNNENKEQKNIKIKNKNNGRKKFKLEVLEIIDEITLYKKIHESILRTFSYNQMQILKNGIKYKSK